MDPQFCSTFHVAPKLVPVVVRPTTPVGYRPYEPASPQYSIPLFPVHPYPGATTSKTRRELEQLGGPREDLTEMIFELAAQKNGIRIGAVANNGGTTKQGDSLEDFKKIAQKNGITVCPAGLNNKAESVITESDLTSVSTTAPQQDLSRSLSSSVNDIKISCGNESSPKGQDTSEAQEEMSLFEAEVETEMNSKPTAFDLFKEKAVKSGIIHVVQDVADSARNQTEQNSSQSVNSETVSKGGAQFGFSKGKLVDELKAKPVVSTSDSQVENVNELESTNVNNTLGNADTQNETKIEDINKENVKTSMVEMTANHNSQSFDLTKSTKNGRSSEECLNMTSSESMSTVDSVSMDTTYSVEDAQIAAFQEVARLKGIKVGRVSNEAKSSTDPCKEQRTESVEANDFADVFDFTQQDVQIARFQEMARLNGIKVGGSKRFLSDSCSENVESVLVENPQESEYYSAMESEMTLLETDPQIARFQELAQMNGIKVNSSRSSSYSSVSTANSDVHFCTPGNGNYSIEMQSPDMKGDIFEQLAKRNGIKVGKKTDPKELPVMKNAIVLSEASTQTEVTIVVDCHSQTCEENCNISKQNAGVQVSATKEAFEEEYFLWKLDDNAVDDEAELRYKDLYFDERRAREELSGSLQNEKDISASVRHNHKRAVDELKEELSSKTEESEKMKKDFKALKKHKETEIKRISKELKSREEELETTKHTLQLKEVALEGVRAIAQEQTAKIKALEEQLEEMKSALSEVQKNEECKTCLKRNTVSREELKDTCQDEQSDDGWTVFIGKKSKSPSYKPAKNNKAQYGGISELCDIDLAGPPCKYTSGESVDQKKSDCEMQSSSMSDVSYECDSLKSPENDSVKSRANSVISVTTIEEEAQNKPTTQDKTMQNDDGKSSSQSYQQNSPNVANVNAQKPTVVQDSKAGQTPPVLFPSAFPGQQHQLPAIPPELLSQYLSNHLQMLQQICPPGGGVLPKSSAGPVRRPPGLNTEPVPEGEVPEQSPPPPPPPTTGKFSSFDKLMEALHKRFPSKNRQELIVCLKKAKASCGMAGFRGMQIPDVVKCVEDLVQLEEKPTA